jgi:hypothetical protein
MGNFIEYLPGIMVLLVFVLHTSMKKMLIRLYGKRVYSVSILMLISFCLGVLANAFHEMLFSGTLLLQALLIGFVVMVFLAILKNAKIAIGAKN